MKRFFLMHASAVLFFGALLLPGAAAELNPVRFMMPNGLTVLDDVPCAGAQDRQDSVFAHAADAGLWLVHRYLNDTFAEQRVGR